MSYCYNNDSDLYIFLNIIFRAIYGFSHKRKTPDNRRRVASTAAGRALDIMITANKKTIGVGEISIGLDAADDAAPGCRDNSNNNNVYDLDSTAKMAQPY